jgi:hypothetical protein
MLFVQVNLYKVPVAKIWSACHVIEDYCTLSQMLGAASFPPSCRRGTWRERGPGDPLDPEGALPRGRPRRSMSSHYRAKHWHVDQYLQRASRLCHVVREALIRRLNWKSGRTRSLSWLANQLRLLQPPRRHFSRVWMPGNASTRQGNRWK